ncbi:MAG: TraB domain-containing protein [Candidatus Heimdallarchaeota archaeon]
MVKIALLGITHIDIESQEKVTSYLNNLKPDAVCLELDEYRLEMLLENDIVNNTKFSKVLRDKVVREEDLITEEEDDEEIEFDEIYSEKNFSEILRKIGFFENQIAQITNVNQPGREMLVAYNIAQELGATIYLIDQSVNDISKVLEEEVSSEEAENFQELVDTLTSERKIVAKPIPENENNTKPTLESIENNNGNNEINLLEVLTLFKDEESIGEILLTFQKSFPKLFSVLLEDRNSHMIKEILKIKDKHQTIVVILGYGHVTEVAKGLKENGLEVEILN